MRRDNATVYLTGQIETLLKHFGRADKPNDLGDHEVGNLYTNSWMNSYSR